MTPFIEPDWPAPPGVLAVSTTRRGGVSGAPYDSFNLAAHVGDAATAVARNREQLLRDLGGVDTLQWLDQVHGSEVIVAGSETLPRADASISRHRGLACVVLTADCLPVLLCDRAGACVAAAHAGWRGLAGGVLEQTVARMDVPASELMAWLGPAIGPATFEVGPEVREVFLQGAPDAELGGIRRSFAQGRGDRYLADLYQLARLALQRSGVEAVYGGGRCTFTEKEAFFSYRRDGPTGRMATLISLI